MNKRTLIIGIKPEYDYPGKLELWWENNTRYAANLGACLITNSLIKQFDGTFVDDLSDVDRLNSEFDECVLALATHIHPKRDIWQITSAVEKLDMPTYFISGGISDYDQDNLNYALHPSVTRLLEIASDRSRWIGVRGYYTASILYRLGFEKVVPIGCPTFFTNLDGPLQIEKPAKPGTYVVPYHLTLSREIPDWVQGKNIVGQDFQDQVVFSNDLAEDTRLINWLKNEFDEAGYRRMISIVEESGNWFSTFNDWFNFIGDHDFVLGPRLHGCAAGLIQRKPTVLATRDLRTREISEFFDIPTISYQELKNKSVPEVFAEVDFTAFNDTHARRYANYLCFLNENGLKSNHSTVESTYCYTAKDMARAGVVASQTSQLSGQQAQQNQTDFSLRLARKIKRSARRIKAMMGRGANK